MPFILIFTMLLLATIVSNLTYFLISYSKMRNIRNTIKELKMSRLIWDLPILSVKISLAMLIAAFRMIVPRSMKHLLGETVLVSFIVRTIKQTILCNVQDIYYFTNIVKTK